MAFDIFKNFAKPGALQLASKTLADAEVCRLQAMEQVEYYSAIEKMYKERIARLKKDIKSLTEDITTDEASV
jgi:phage host-nuclease inhibitor protein Gam